MNGHRIIKFAILMFVIIALCSIIKSNYVRSMKSLKSRHKENITNSFKELSIQNEKDIDAIGEILLLAIENDVKWDDLNLSDNFKSKFKNGRGILPDKNEYEMFDVGHDSDFAEYNRYTVWIRGDKYENIFNTLRYGEPVSTEFIFEYKIDENNLLDDVKLIRRKDVYSLTGERVDGAKEVTYDCLNSYIHKLANPANPNVNEFFSDIPLTKDSKILNKPNLEELGTPLNSICELSKEQLTLTFIYPSYKKVWNVKYNIDLDYKLDYIEFAKKS